MKTASGRVIEENGHLVWDCDGPAITLEEINAAIEAVRQEREDVFLAGLTGKSDILEPQPLLEQSSA